MFRPSFQFERRSSRRWRPSVRRSFLRLRRTFRRQVEPSLSRRCWPTRLPRVQPRCLPRLWLRPQLRPLCWAEASSPIPTKSTQRTTSVLIALDSVRKSNLILLSPSSLNSSNGRALPFTDPCPTGSCPALWQTWCHPSFDGTRAQSIRLSVPPQCPLCLCGYSTLATRVTASTHAFQTFLRPPLRPVPACHSASGSLKLTPRLLQFNPAQQLSNSRRRGAPTPPQPRARRPVERMSDLKP